MASPNVGGVDRMGETRDQRRFSLVEALPGIIPLTAPILPVLGANTSPQCRLASARRPAYGPLEGRHAANR
jgi:hypothetical protein